MAFQSVSPAYDYPLRYAIWRLVVLAVDRDPLAGLAERLELNWKEDDPESFPPDLTLSGMSGESLESISCRDHSDFLPASSLHEFLEAVQSKRATSGGPPHFRFVSGTRLFRPPSKGRIRDLVDPADRREALALSGLAHLDGSDISWDLGPTYTKFSLTADVLVHFARAQRGQDREHYLSLYKSLVAPLGSRPPFPQSLMLQLYSEEVPELAASFPPAIVEGITVSAFKNRLLLSQGAAQVPAAVSREKITTALRRGLFGETSVTLEDLYVHQGALLAFRTSREGRVCYGRATESNCSTNGSPRTFPGVLLVCLYWFWARSARENPVC